MIQNSYKYGWLVIVLCFLGVSCTSEKLSWKEELHNDISLLGHRNWIVVTDMAYPLQSQEGIKTICTGDDFLEVLSFVTAEIDRASHIKANVYQDRELLFMKEADASGLTELRQEVAGLFGEHLQYVPHEELIARLDSISSVFNVIILKSNLTIPYTSTFFELDCFYWDDVRQQELEKRFQEH